MIPGHASLFPSTRRHASAVQLRGKLGIISVLGRGAGPEELRGQRRPFLLEALSRAAAALCSPYHLERSAPAPPVLEHRASRAAASPRAAPRSARGRRTASTTAPCIRLRRGHWGRPRRAARGRGGAGGPSRSGAVWGASDARRLGGGLSGCSARHGLLPICSAVGAARRRRCVLHCSRFLQSGGASAFGTQQVAFHTSSL